MHDWKYLWQTERPHNQKKAEYNLLIDPCIDNPEDFFVFDDLGNISSRSTLSENNKERAEFTIKAFGLDNPRLIQKRKENLKRHQWMKQYPNQLSENLRTIDSEPFITAIYHYFGKRFVS